MLKTFFVLLLILQALHRITFEYTVVVNGCK